MARERERVARGATQGDVLVLRDLSKVGAECWLGAPAGPPPPQGSDRPPGVPWAEDASCRPPVPGDPPW